MKKILLVAAFLLLGLASAFAQKNEKSVGAMLNFGGETSSFGLGAKFGYNVTNEIRISPSLHYFFKNNYKSSFIVDLDGHYLFPFANQFAAYPIGGITFQSWKYSIDLPIISNISETRTRFGLNMGGGIQYDINADWRVFSELKYSIVSDYNQLIYSIGIVFKFN